MSALKLVFDLLREFEERIKAMKRKASVSHEKAIVRRLHKEPDFAVEYLKSALDDADEPRVFLVALRHLAQAQPTTKEK